MPGPDCAKSTVQPTTGDDRHYLRQMREILHNGNQSNGTSDGSLYVPTTPSGPPMYPVQLLDHVYIGNQRNADNVELLRKLCITHVLNCAGLRRFDFTRSPYPKDAGIKGFLMISAEDHEDFDIKGHFEEAIAFLDNVKRTRGRALVHCNLGVNRSGAVVAAYLMAAERRTLLDVTSYLKSKRHVILSNKGFRRQLIQFARERGLLDPVVVEQDDRLVKTDTTADNSVNTRNESANSRNGPNIADQCRPTPVVIVESSTNNVDIDMNDHVSHTSRTSWSYGSSSVRTPRYGDNTDRYSVSKYNVSNNSWLLSPVYEKPCSTGGEEDSSATSMFGGFLTLLGGRRKPLRSTSFSNVFTSSATSLSSSQTASVQPVGSSPVVEPLPEQTTKTLSSTVRPLRIYTRSSTDSELYRPPSARGRPNSASLVNHQRFSDQHGRPSS